ncbi:MAG: hypothetical protein AAGA03_04880, partial [Planctomycetota bacterium]
SDCRDLPRKPFSVNYVRNFKIDAWGWSLGDAGKERLAKYNPVVEYKYPNGECEYDEEGGLESTSYLLSCLTCDFDPSPFTMPNERTEFVTRDSDMPHYDYFCPSNGETVEVFHSMTDSIETWGELCDRAEREAGETDAKTPVERVLSTGLPIAGIKGSGSGSSDGCCGGGGCGC